MATPSWGESRKDSINPAQFCGVHLIQRNFVSQSNIRGGRAGSFLFYPVLFSLLGLGLGRVASRKFIKFTKCASQANLY